MVSQFVNAVGCSSDEATQILTSARWQFEVSLLGRKSDRRSYIADLCVTHRVVIDVVIILVRFAGCSQPVFSGSLSGPTNFNPSAALKQLWLFWTNS
jgi:hypothetical protein